jgi:hypothetical protein
MILRLQVTCYQDRLCALSTTITAYDSAVQLARAVLSPVFAEAFVLTFLAEWGDRSQIATIGASDDRRQAISKPTAQLDYWFCCISECRYHEEHRYVPHVFDAMTCMLPLCEFIAAHCMTVDVRTQNTQVRGYW